MVAEAVPVPQRELAPRGGLCCRPVRIAEGDRLVGHDTSVLRRGFDIRSTVSGEIFWAGSHRR